MDNENSKENLNKNKLTRRRKKKTNPKKVAIISVAVIAVIALGVYLTATTLLGKMNRKKLDETDLGINQNVTDNVERDKIDNIVNIALFGVDSSEGDHGRSDAIMVATFDPVHKKLKVTSFLRDSYVPIDGYGRDKLNHAYSYGGPQLAIKTLNQNFDLNISDYVQIDFANLQHVVDALGGIDMEMTQVEADEVSDYARRVSSAEGRPNEPVVLDETGKAHLTGFQALGYCRIRSTAGGDLDRTERHRKILTEMFNQISKAGTTQLASMSLKLLPYVETSLDNKEILDLAYNVLTLGTKNIKQERFPRDEYMFNTDIGGVFYFTFDEEYTAEQVHEYIFNDREMWLEENQKIYVPNYEQYGGIPYGTSNYIAPEQPVIEQTPTPPPTVTPEEPEVPKQPEEPANPGEGGEVPPVTPPVTPPAEGENPPATEQP